MRARIAAVDGRPTPMKTLRAWRSRRAATTVCVSALAEDMLVHPGGEALAVAGDHVPLAVEVVVAPREAQRVGRLRAAGRLGDVVDHPAGDGQPAGPGVERVDDALDRHQGSRRGEHGLLLDSGNSPE